MHVAIGSGDEPGLPDPGRGIFPLTLSQNETIAVEPYIRNDAIDPLDKAPLGKNLRFKIGRIIVKQEESGNPSTLYLTPQEVYYLLDVIPITIMVGKDMVGLRIKRQLYSYLLEVGGPEEEAKRLDEAVGSFYHAPTDVINDLPLSTTQKTSLESFLKEGEEDASTNPGPCTCSNCITEHCSCHGAPEEADPR